MRDAPSDAPAPAQSANGPQPPSSVDVFNPKPNTSSSHLPSPNVIPVSLWRSFHRVPQVRSTVEREARITCGYVRGPRRPSIIPSVSKCSTSSDPSNMDERVPLLPSRRNTPVMRPRIKTEFVPFAMVIKAAYRWVRRSKDACDLGEVCNQARAIRNRRQFECTFNECFNIDPILTFRVGSRISVRFPTPTYPYSVRAQRTPSNRRKWIQHTLRSTKKLKRLGRAFRVKRDSSRLRLNSEVPETSDRSFSSTRRHRIVDGLFASL